MPTSHTNTQLKQEAKTKRKDIPEKIVTQLCVRAGGHCEFDGCNTYVFEHPLTLDSIKTGQIAHIVAVSHDWARGDDPLPDSRRNDIENLMLLCRTCHALVDSKEHAERFPADLLRSWKQSHEQRIRTLTEIKGNRKSTFICLKGKIGDQVAPLDPNELRQAALPNYSDGRQFVIDLLTLESPATPEDYRYLCTQIDRQLRDTDAATIDGHELEPRSVFAFARIPLMVYFGSRLSSKVTTRIFNRHFNGQGWKWSEQEPEYDFATEKVRDGDGGAALLVQVSREINLSSLPEELNGYAIYSIKPVGISAQRDLVRNEKTLEKFRKAYRQVISEIHTSFGQAEVHLFLAAPVAVAVSCGFDLLNTIDPPLKVYDWDGATKSYQPYLTTSRHGN